MASVEQDRATIEEAIKRQHGGNGGNGNGGGSGTLQWRDLLITGDKGKPLAMLANAITAFRYAPEWFGLLRFDVFGMTTVLHGKPPWSLQAADRQRWTGLEDIRAANWLQHQGIRVGPDITRWAIEEVAHDLCFHPVRDYLKALDWDRQPRHLAIDYFGAEDNPYNRAVAARWMISAVARVMAPGTKVDCAVILEGRQGLLKSTALRVLGDPWFTDELAEMGSKDAAMQLHGTWILELAELDSMTRAEVSRIKSFMTRQIDKFRPPYGHRPEPFPRQCVFAGSVNENQYLRDPTGGRRFWPLACGKLDIDRLQRDRDQLWAEAYARYRVGEPWWLNDELETAAHAEQRLRAQTDPWAVTITDHLARRSSVTTEDVLGFALGIPVKDQKPQDFHRVTATLMQLGWRPSRQRVPGKGRPRIWTPESM